MLPTFVIGLREGLEAALIVGIIAAFLRKQGRRELLRWVWLGVGTAIVLCVAAGVALNLVSKELPQHQQEGLETVIGALAVGMVTYMVIWMKRNSRGLKGQLEDMAADAMNGTSRAARAMILMAFLAVLREGVETVIFLLAAFNQSASGADAPVGAALGIVVAIALGYGIYRGGVRLNLSKFFRATGLVLVLVAAGLVVNALHTAHEAGWLDFAQGRTIDLSWLVSPGSVQSSLLTGMLGLQSRPVVIEVIGWLVYLVPVGLFVAWPPGRSPARPPVSRACLAAGAALGVAAVVLALVAPGRPADRPSTGSARVIALSGATATVQLAGRRLTLQQSGFGSRNGVDLRVYTSRHSGTKSAALPSALSNQRIAALNGGRLPIGLPSTQSVVPVRYRDSVTESVQIEPRTGRIIDARSTERITAAVVDPARGTLPLLRPVSTVTIAQPPALTRAAAGAAATDVATLEHRSLTIGLAWSAGALAGLLLLAGLALSIGTRRSSDETAAASDLPSELIRS